MIPALPASRTLSIHPGLASIPRYDYALHGKKSGSVLAQAFHLSYLDCVLDVARKFIHTPDPKPRFNFRTHFKGKNLTPKAALKAVPYFDSPWCSKCAFATSCPYFLQGQVCFFFARILHAERTDRAFRARLQESMRVFCFASTIFMQEATDTDLDVAFFLVLLVQRLDEDLTRPDRRLKSKDPVRKTPLGRRIRRTEEIAEIDQQRQDIQRRWDHLGLPSKPTRDYYPHY